MATTKTTVKSWLKKYLKIFYDEPERNARLTTEARERELPAEIERLRRLQSGQ